jgi:spermidine/putrescine transport system ATP-binding protein
MNAGRVEQMGAPAGIYEFPATLFTATFLGRSNLFPATVTGRSGADVTVTVEGDRFALPATRSRASGETVFLGVRPEKVRIIRPGDPVPDGDNRVSGVITDTCYAGVSTEYLVRTAWGQELSVFASNATADGPAAPGAEVVLHWHPAHSFLLDRAGEALAPPEPVDLAEAPRYEEVR